MRTPARKRLGRVDYPQYDLAAVFEAIVNAVAHRDYSRPAQRIRLFMFRDRLEVNTPGALPNSMTIESMTQISAPRNEVIASLFARYYPVEEGFSRHSPSQAAATTLSSFSRSFFLRCYSSFVHSLIVAGASSHICICLASPGTERRSAGSSFCSLLLSSFWRPDLVERLRADAALNTPDMSTFYTPNAKGFTDHPTLASQT